MNHNLGILIPYRNRKDHLDKFIPYMNNFLEKLDINYVILVIEQLDSKPFNRAKLLNIGFNFLKDRYDYFVFHDIDMLPEKNSDYSYCDTPTHLAQRLEELAFKNPTQGWGRYYKEYFGGVTMFNREDFIKINGYSNNYWGWGKEDDDLRLRCIKEGLTIKTRQNLYHSLQHSKTREKHPDFRNNWDNLNKLKMDNTKSYLKEGLNTLEYDFVDVEDNDGFIKVKVNV
tara:strand:- start:771 stop:1454 length:684 start_codon:yes stop_codon:yes gene_type:complete